MAALDKIRGINFGNWLVLEKWMSPDVFGDSPEEDETWLARTLPPGELKARLTRHRNSYITEEDFRLVARHGYNLVRIPVPYFLFGDRPPFLGCVDCLDNAFTWAERYGLQILLDLHTVPGSQNGYDNGGLVGVCKWHKDPREVAFALSVLERLAGRYGTRAGLYGIEVLNEPISFLVYRTSGTTGKAKDKQEAKGSGHVPLAFLKDFYRRAYHTLRAVLPSDKVIVFHDGFRLSRWKDFFRREGMENVLLDTHIYLFAMEYFVPVSFPWLYKLYVALEKRKIEKAARWTPVVVGEWCIECRYPFAKADRQGKNEAEKQDIRRQEYRRVAALQRQAWETSRGWIYWTYQLDRDPDGPMRLNQFGHKCMEAWSMRRLWKHGWWPEETEKEEAQA